MRRYRNPRGGALPFAVLALVAVCWAAPARAAQLVEVRVGQHADYTRIVFELDGASAFHLEPLQKGSGEIMVTLDAQSVPRVVSSRSPLLKEVRLHPGPDGSVVQLSLRSEDVHVTQMVLKSPHRIVLDLRRREPAKLARAPEPAKKPEARAPVPAGSQPPESASLSGEPASSIQKEVAPQASPSQAAPPVASVGAEKKIPEPRAKPALLQQQLAQRTAPAPTPSRAKPVATPSASKPRAARSPEPKRAAKPEKKKPSATGIPAWLTDPLALAGIGALIVILFLVWRGMRSRAIEVESEPLPFPPVEDTESGFSVEDETAEDVEEEVTAFDPSAVESAFEAEPSETEPEPDPEKDEETLQVETSTIPGELPRVEETEPVVPLPGLGIGDVVHRVEQRVEQLEGRIQELVDERGRLERQLNAQTEELRVQRAAIARTQRVVRSLARPEDQSTDTTPGS